MKATRTEVYALIDGERDYQERKWTPETATNRGVHSIEDYLVYIRSYLREAEEVLTRQPQAVAAARAQCLLRKITALGVAAFEQHGAPSREQENKTREEDRIAALTVLE